MKKMLLVATIILLSSGFTFQSVSNKKVESSCPYLNQIHRQINDGNSGCPYLEGKVLGNKEEDSEKSVCPYLNNLKQGNESESECPYLNRQEEKIKDIKPTVQIKLKSS